MRAGNVDAYLQGKAREILREHASDPTGTIVPFHYQNALYAGIIEQHYHPPGGPVKPWGRHPGVSLFRCSE